MTRPRRLTTWPRRLRLSREVWHQRDGRAAARVRLGGLAQRGAWTRRLALSPCRGDPAAREPLLVPRPHRQDQEDALQARVLLLPVLNFCIGCLVYTYRMTHRTVESPPSFFSSRCPRPDRDENGDGVLGTTPSSTVLRLCVAARHHVAPAHDMRGRRRPARAARCLAAFSKRVPHAPDDLFRR